MDDNRIRRRIAEIDQHVAVLMKERDELIFAERVLDRLADGGGGKPNPAPVVPPKSAGTGDDDGIEAALAKLENRVGLT